MTKKEAVVIFNARKEVYRKIDEFYRTGGKTEYSLKELRAEAKLVEKIMQTLGIATMIDQATA